MQSDLKKWLSDLKQGNAEARMWAAFHLGEIFADGSQYIGELLNAYFQEEDRQASSSMCKAIQRIVFASAKTNNDHCPAELTLGRIRLEMNVNPERATYLARQLGIG